MAERRTPRRSPPPPASADNAQTNPMLREPTRTWDSPGIPNYNQPPLPGITGRVQADITREYVSSMPSQWYLNLTRVLSFEIDDVTRDFGYDLYNRILFDAIANSATIALKAAILEEGFTLRPAVTDADADGYDIAKQLVTEFEQILDNYSGGNFDDWLWEMADAVWRGNTASEITLTEDRTFTGRLQYTIDRLAVKPVQSYGFAVDTYKRIIGIMALIPGVGMPVLIGNVVVDPSKQPNMLPRDKFAIYTHRPRDEDPRGTSILRAVYTAWNLKMQIIPAYAKWLAQFASPTLLGFTAPDAAILPAVDSNGNVTSTSNPLVETPGGNQIPSPTPEQQMRDVLTQVASGTAAAFPYGATVQPLEMHGMGNPFLFALKWCDEQITTGILGQSMTTLPAKYGSQALGSVQENTFETIVHRDKAGICRTTYRDLFRLIVHYNHGDKFLRYTPKPYLGEVEEQDFRGDANAFSLLGYTVDQSQFPGVDKRLGLPERAAGWEDRLIQLPTNQAQSRNNQQRTAAGQQHPSDTQPDAANTQQQKSDSSSDNSKSTSTPTSKNTRYERSLDYIRQAQEAQFNEYLERERNNRWHEAVHLSDALRQATGIRTDPALPPPSMEDVQRLAGVR